MSTYSSNIEIDVDINDIYDEGNIRNMEGGEKNGLCI